MMRRLIQGMLLRWCCLLLQEFSGRHPGTPSSTHLSGSVSRPDTCQRGDLYRQLPLQSLGLLSSKSRTYNPPCYHLPAPSLQGRQWTWTCSEKHSAIQTEMAWCHGLVPEVQFQRIRLVRRAGATVRSEKQQSQVLDRLWDFLFALRTKASVIERKQMLCSRDEVFPTTQWQGENRRMFLFVTTDGFTFCISNPWISSYDINKLYSSHVLMSIN